MIPFPIIARKLVRRVIPAEGPLDRERTQGIVNGRCLDIVRCAADEGGEAQGSEAEEGSSIGHWGLRKLAATRASGPESNTRATSDMPAVVADRLWEPVQ